jgi:hypothetical protein
VLADFPHLIDPGIKKLQQAGVLRESPEKSCATT